MTGYELDHRRSSVGSDGAFSPHSHILGPTQISVDGYQDIKRPGREAEVKDVSPLTCLLGMVLRPRVNFTFTVSQATVTALSDDEVKTEWPGFGFLKMLWDLSHHSDGLCSPQSILRRKQASVVCLNVCLGVLRFHGIV